MNFFAALGLIGNLLFATACITMAWKTWRLGRDIGNSPTTIWTFTIANATFGAYLLGTFGFHWLLSICMVETACWVVALWYHYFPRAVDNTIKGADGLTELERSKVEQYGGYGSDLTAQNRWSFGCRCSPTSGSSECPIHRSGEP